MRWGSNAAILFGSGLVWADESESGPVADAKVLLNAAGRQVVFGKRAVEPFAVDELMSPNCGTIFREAICNQFQSLVLEPLEEMRETNGLLSAMRYVRI